MKRVYEAIDNLIAYAKANLCLDERNEDYVRNGIFRHLGLDSYGEDISAVCNESSPDTLLDAFTSACVEAGLFEEYEREYYCDEVMGELSLTPAEVQDKFKEHLKSSGKAAMSWLYDYCVKNDYVKKSKLDKNPRFDASNGLIVTINKSKPEFRDPKKAKAGNATKGGYPKCSICHSNEGFAGRNKRTLRAVDLTLGGQKWFWQYSPYGYFHEHGIAVNYNHRPMYVDKSAFYRLMDFVDTFPHYFIGCNAPLPSIGGSVLAHDHYQGGGEILPMHRAKAAYVLKDSAHKGVKVEVLDWPGTVVRVVGKNREDIADVSEKIRSAWVSYENRELEIIPEDENGVHSAISPTVVKTERGYEMSIILRNNVTNEKYPDGIFHAHPEFHSIKKESIGLIEAQGLFILPGRLEGQLAEIRELIVNGKNLTKELEDFEMIYKEIKALCKDDFSAENVEKAVKEELGSVCYRILENTAVFKDKKQTLNFLENLGYSL